MIAFGLFLFEPVHKSERDMVKKLVLIALMGMGISLMSGCKWSGCSCQCGCHAPANVSSKTDSSVLTIGSVTDFDTQVLKSQKTVVIDFSASWCGACKTMKPLFEHVAREYANFVFASVDVDAHADIAQKYNITGIPAFIFIKEGKEVGRAIGAMDEASFKQLIQKYIS
jgi:thioredoxin 1